MRGGRLIPLLAGGLTAIRAKLDPEFRRPLGVYIHLTERCDGRCAYCGYERMAATTNRQLTGEFVIDCVRQFAALGARKLNLTGGEPLLVPDLERIIATAKQHGMFVAVSTNGLALAGQVHRLRDADVVMVSVDGREPVHDALRGEGAHRRVLASLRALRAARIPFWTTTVLTRATLGEIEAVLAIAREFGAVANFTLIQYLPEPDRHFVLPGAARIRELIPTEGEARVAVRRLLELKRAGEPVGSTTAFLDYLLAWPDYGRLTDPLERGIACQAGRLYCHLYADGKLYACGQGYGWQEGEPIGADGVAGAFRRLRRVPGCRACRVACDMENSLIYDLRPGAVGNWLRQLLR